LIGVLADFYRLKERGGEFLYGSDKGKGAQARKFRWKKSRDEISPELKP
jgi:hypothetical protein